ncbi:MAG: phosphonate ABC transporter, permease protein PhnE [Chloroflexales bacterium]
MKKQGLVSSIKTGAELERPAAVPRERLITPWPQIDVRQIITAVVLIMVVGWALNGSKANPASLVEGVPHIVDFVTRLFPLKWDMDTTLLAVPAPLQGLLGAQVTLTTPLVLPYIVETLQMAIVGTILGVALSLPLGLLAARNVSPHPAVYQATRLILNINRAIPEIIFALIFVAAVGLGPFGGVLALGVGAVGSLAKLYAESIEQIDPQQVLAVQATGAGPMQTFIYGVVPQALPLIATYSLLNFEHNVRSATILGLVGAGGIGFILQKYISLFQYRNLMSTLIIIIVMVTVIDRVSDSLRKKLI